MVILGTDGIMKDICESLGLDVTKTRSLTFRAAVDELVTIEVGYYPGAEEVDVDKLKKTFNLIKLGEEVQDA